MRLIDADAFKTRLEHEAWNRGHVELLRARDIADESPAVDAVPVRHGKWLPKHHYIAGYEFVSGHICSECGNDALNAEGDDFLTDYCPNCGAKMDERKTNEYSGE